MLTVERGPAEAHSTESFWTPDLNIAGHRHRCPVCFWVRALLTRVLDVRSFHMHCDSVLEGLGTALCGIFTFSE